MFEYIFGKIVAKKDRYVVLENRGIGYKIFCSSNCIKQANNECKMYLVNIIREDSNTLYGFLDEIERSIFEIVISTSGIGPKLAMDILSTFIPSQIRDCILSEKIPLLTKVPGLGVKKAKKLILESRDKIKLISVEENVSYLKEDIIEAMISLGYSRKDILQNIGEYDSIEDGIKDMLSKLS